MIKRTPCTRLRPAGVPRRSGVAVLAATVVFLWSGAASAFYIGDSYLSIPGSAGHWVGSKYKHWIRADASDWTGILRRISSGPGDALAGDKLYFGGPGAPHPGGTGKLTLQLPKNSADLPSLMEKCTSKALIPEATYAESSDRSRPVMELGPHPKEFPDYWEYRLRDVQISDCPQLADAPEQAFVLSFKDIEWLSYDPKRSLTNKVVVTAKDIPDVQPAQATAKAKTKVFVITWIAPNSDTTEQQCPVMNSKPTDEDVFRYLSPADVAKIKAKNGEKGVTAGGQSELRGPDRISAVMFPGIVPDPGFAEPKTTIADGIDLDHDDGRGSPPRGICKHTNYTAPDGRTGIDNQYFAVSGCIPGYRGKGGYRNQTSNARRADGNTTTLIEVSNIHDERNDRHVEVALIYSRDKPIRDASGKYVANYTFRPTTNPNFSLYNVRLRGRITNGVITTEPVHDLKLNLGQDPLLQLFDAQMRLEILPDGSLKAVLAGYRDWREIASTSASGYSEGLFGYQAPGLYDSLKRNADGMKNPVTGECDGISIAYEVDGVPAFLTADAPQKTVVAQGNADAGNSK